MSSHDKNIVWTQRRHLPERMQKGVISEKKAATNTPKVMVCLPPIFADNRPPGTCVTM